MRIALMVIRKLFLVPILYCRICYLEKKYDGDYVPGFLCTKAISSNAIDAGNITAEIHGIENIPQEDGFIFYPNHQGYFDTLMFYASSPKPFSVVIKKEARNLFLLKQVMGSTGSLAMDREDIRQSMQVINQVAEEVKKGRNFLIFAEGHRSRQGNTLLPFKGGSFKAAQKAKCPIVPCALINSYIPFDERSIRKVTVKLIYLPPINYEEYGHLKTSEIADLVHDRIEEAIAKYSD